MGTHNSPDNMLRSPPKPPNFHQAEYPPLNNLNIASPQSFQNGRSEHPINSAAAVGGFGGNGSRRKIRLPQRPYDLKEGRPIVTFSKAENDMLAKTGKLTLIGKFSRIRPSIEKIRDDFKKNIQLKGSVKIEAYNLHHVFLDFDLEEDHRTIYGKFFLTLCNLQMKLLKWTTEFIPEAETSLAPVEIDITKPQITEIQIVIKNENGELEAIKQKVEYENDQSIAAIVRPKVTVTPIAESFTLSLEEITTVKEERMRIYKGPGKREKRNEDRSSQCPIEDDEGWTTVTKGKGKKSTLGNNNQTGQSRIKSSSQLDPPRNGKDDKVLDSIEEQPKIFGITFKAQKTNKVETNNPMRGKRKVTSPTKGEQEAKKEIRMMETKTPLKIDIHKPNKKEEYKEENAQTTDKDPLQTTIRIDKEVEESLDPVDRGKEMNNFLKGDEYNHYESASEEEMEEDQFHDIQDHQIEKEAKILSGGALGDPSISTLSNTNDSNLVTVPIKLITKGTTLIDKDCYMVDSVNNAQMSVRTLSDFDRFKIIKKQNNISINSLQEPFVNADHITHYMRMLDMHGSFANVNNKIWLFWANDFNITILHDTPQHVICYANHVNSGAKTILRRTLWEDLVSISNNIQGPWSIMGDFNVIAKVEEKLGRTPYRLEKSFDFLNFMDDTGVQDTGFVGNIFTWCNNRGAPNTIWKRLERMLYNSEWFNLFNKTSVTHLPITCSPHHPQFLEVMGKIWSFECQGNPMWILHQKLKRTASLISTWSRNTYGDIFEDNNSPSTRASLNKIKVEYKSRVKWLVDRDSNTSYFHKTIKDKRRRIGINKIMDEDQE
ncbi:hypothetical protein H5410_037853 [Solanum commersonii]|uniref:DUF4283 domain-containing protein n=1 Tax=Solanum commersonii TaxID=4109 RepID=A0A9J5Y933_SOLCO|nr:hypothetical protein H5410_037853 [Solanum commersonii]